MKKLCYFFMFIAITACDSREQVLSIPIDGDLYFSQSVSGDWDQLCIFEPYSDNQKAAALLGFDWDLESNSNISAFDDITLLVFASSSEIISYHDVKRNTDFSPLAGQCYGRLSANFNISGGEVSLIK